MNIRAGMLQTIELKHTWMKTNLPPLTLAVLFALVLNATADTRYVDLNSPSPTPPYTNWLTAATNIQDAIDAAVSGDLVLVTNGVYGSGGVVVPAIGLLTNRVAVTKAVNVLGVNGPAVTIIQGNQVFGSTNGNSAVRCVYLGNNSSLSGFTLTNGATRTNGATTDLFGGGIYCQTGFGCNVTNCVIVGNSAAARGGGVYQGFFINSQIISNVSGLGGGAYGSLLNYSTVSGNAAINSIYGIAGGGANLGTLVGCTISGNYSSNGGGGVADGTLRQCVLDSNKAFVGGGSTGGYLENCLIMNNVADIFGGGTYQGSLLNCTVVNNSALSYGHVDSNHRGGGTHLSTCQNCIVYFNTDRKSVV